MPRKPSVGFVAGAAVIVLFSVNFASGFSAVSNAGGSPNQLWEENLDYQRTELGSGDVVLSWWDYGYWFENIGERAAVADGSNAGYYTSIPQTNKTNYPIADMLTSSNYSQHRDLLEKHGVDYIVMDQTMIGKYSAVSQISNRDNSDFQSMPQVGTGSARSSLSGDVNNSVLTLSGRIGRLRASVYAPVDISGSGVSISGAPTLETRRGRTQIGCVLTEEGEKEFNVTQESTLCVAENPFYSLDRGISTDSRTRLVLVPKSMRDHSLVDLYLQDGRGVPYVEKVPEASNGYVKMWRVTEGA